MNIKNLSKQELIDLKKDIDLQIINIENELKSDLGKLHTKNKLSDLNKKDKIFCIHYHKDTVMYMTHVNIIFSKNEDLNYMKFSINHDNLPLGCSSGLEYEEMENHCFLSLFPSSNIYFFTLRPENWEDDIKIELKKILKRKRKYFNSELTEIKNDINNIFKNKNFVDDEIEKMYMLNNTNKFNL